jgi:hypothetical protein
MGAFQDPEKLYTLVHALTSEERWGKIKVYHENTLDKNSFQQIWRAS